ncbi:MAG: UV DNA damage repair endonuclease UvsE [Patescibacteria group bacterium]|jgi:UV DNA damage endonuclease
MKIGYASTNTSLPCKSTKTFRFSSFSEARFRETVVNNLDCLKQILNFNLQHNILFFRITSDLIPFASHPINRIPWQEMYADKLASLGKFVWEKGMRVGMHPDQFVVINSSSSEVVKNSVAELVYHVEVLNLMNLDYSHKIQIHIGGAYGDKLSATARFINRYKSLPETVKRRLVIENDETLYGVKDCLWVSEQTGIPIVFDIFHYRIKEYKDTVKEVMQKVALTWKQVDGLPIVDYSNQAPNKRFGSHSQTIDTADFMRTVQELKGFDFDIMLEVKDKEISAIKALEAIKQRYAKESSSH